MPVYINPKNSACLLKLIYKKYQTAKQNLLKIAPKSFERPQNQINKSPKKNIHQVDDADGLLSRDVIKGRFCSV